MLVLVRLEILLFITQDRCLVCTERTIGSKITLDTPDTTPSDLGLVESDFGPFGESLSIGARYVHGLRRAYHRHENRFGHTR
jgi:hypothetical protein